MVDQAALTIVAAVKPSEEQSLRDLLAAMGRDPAGNEVVPLGRFENVHFARFVLLDATTDLQGRPIGCSLMFLSDVDGDAGRHLEALVDVAGAGLDRIYAHCDGYPADGARTRAGRLAYLRAHSVSADATYVNTRGRTVRQIRQQAQLRDAIEEFLDRSARNWSGADPLVVRKAIQDFVAGEESLRWARRAPSRDVPALLRETVHFTWGVFRLTLLAPFALLALPVFVALLRWHELTDPAPHVRASAARIQQLAALEDYAPQNQFSAIGFLKPGWFRRVVAVCVLWLVNFGARHFFAHADLAGVKTIHFARWVFVDGGRRLLFASNYDGSLENYMGDFIDKVAWGLNAVFSNGVDYPRTNWLIKDGAKDEGAFKDFIRTRQIPTQVWYAAYDHLTAVNVEQNARIHGGLHAKLSPAEVEAWLRLL